MEGAVGSGAGTCCFGYKGGIGTASRRIDIQFPNGSQTYTIGALVQTNFSGNLNIYGYPVPNGMHEMSQDGSCMIVVATDAPLDARQLKRVAKRGIAGMAQTGSYLANGSGDCMRRVHTPSLQGGVVDFCIAFSNYPDNITPRNNRMLKKITTLPDELINPLFEATCESVREAIYNSLTMAEGIVGKDCKCVQAIDMPKVAHQIKARS